jgi:hypothetical protein
MNKNKSDSGMTVLDCSFGILSSRGSSGKDQLISYSTVCTVASNTGWLVLCLIYTSGSIVC